MADLRQAAQQALEALEKYQRMMLVEAGCQSEEGEAAIDTLRAVLEQPNECRWLQDGDEDSGVYMASCNQRYFMFEDGTLTDNRMTHCCYCGKPLVEVPIEPEDNHE
jgi:hypothetical protein